MIACKTYFYPQVAAGAVLFPRGRGGGHPRGYYYLALPGDFENYHRQMSGGYWADRLGMTR